MKRTFRILSSAVIAFACGQAFAAPNQFSIYSCSQGCGLTENPEATVTSISTSHYEALAILAGLCGNRRLRLQGEPRCDEAKYDYTKNERYQRCKQGISPIAGCRVSVYGYGSNDQYQRVFQKTSMVSFDEAETQALAECRQAVGSYGTCRATAYIAY